MYKYVLIFLIIISPAFSDILIEKLGAPKWKDREIATLEILDDPLKYLEILPQHFEHSDPEIKHRCRVIYDKMIEDCPIWLLLKYPHLWELKRKAILKEYDYYMQSGNEIRFVKTLEGVHKLDTIKCADLILELSISPTEYNGPWLPVYALGDAAYKVWKENPNAENPYLKYLTERMYNSYNELEYLIAIQKIKSYELYSLLLEYYPYQTQGLYKWKAGFWYVWYGELETVYNSLLISFPISFHFRALVERRISIKRGIEILTAKETGLHTFRYKPDIKDVNEER